MPVVIAPATRETSGVSTSARTWAFANFPFPTPPRLNLYFNDFQTYDSTDFTVTGTSGSVGMTDGNGGLLAVGTSGATNDIEGFQLKNKCYSFTTGSQVWFSCNLAVGATPTLGTLTFGLANSLTSPGATVPTDGVYFNKAAGSASLTVNLANASAYTQVTVGTLAANTYYTFSYYYNGKDALHVYSTIGQTTANGYITPGNGSGYYSGGNYVACSFGADYANAITNLPATSTNLTAGLAYKASTGATCTATVDYFLAAEEIVGRF